MENSPNQKPAATTPRAAEAFRITGDWQAQSTQLKGKFTQLIDEDLKFESGKEYDLLKRIQKKLNKTRGEVINIIKNVQPVKAL